MTGKPETPGRARTRSAGKRVKAVSTEPRETSSPGVLPRRFRIAQVAEAFGCAPRTVRSWIDKGLLEREKVGNAVFIREDQIEAMLRGETRQKKAVI